jgi:type I restriction enzyme S subunit
LQTLAKGVKPGINRNDVYSLKAHAPDNIEQQRIAGVLDKAFTAIDAAKADASINLERADEVFKSRLKTIFSGPNPGWVEVSLGSVCKSITDGKHADCENDAGSGYFFLSAKDVKNELLNFESARQITQSDFEETHRRTNLEPGDLLITNSGTIGRMAIAPNDPRTFRTTFQKSVAILKPRKGVIDGVYAYFCLMSGLSRLVGVSAGTAQKNLLIRDLREYTFRMPESLDEQQSIAGILVTLRATSVRLEMILQK